MDVFKWANDATDKLLIEFGGHLVFTGIQGSHARGEAHDDSDIDLVVLFDNVNAGCLARCRTIIQSMPHSDLACGFIGSKQALAAWPRHELFQFYHDTTALYGTLPTIDPFTKNDAVQAARMGASGIYHATCHASVFSNNAMNDVLKSLFKNAFFTLQALQFVRTGVYVRTKAELASQLKDDELYILEIGCDWQAHCPTNPAEQRAIVDLLLRWSEGVLTTCLYAEPTQLRQVPLAENEHTSHPPASQPQ